MQEKILKFPLPTKPKANKASSSRLTIGEIEFTIESLKEKGQIEFTPLVLSFSYLGVFSMKETDQTFVVKVFPEPSSEKFYAYIIKK